MASYINVFLKTEITVIPRLLDKYIGKYYNNTVCNGATWMFLSWYILHVIFDDLLNALLRKMKYKEYIRIRLKRSLWYMGFYTTAFLYCVATFVRNNIKFYEAENAFDSTNIPSGHLILGFIVLSTFYLHSAFWERLKYCYAITSLGYLILFFLLCSSYFLRFVEGAFRLTILICSTQIAVELARCAAVLRTKKEAVSAYTNIFFIISIIVFIFNYLIVISLLLNPLMRRFASLSTIILIVFILSWYILAIYDSALFKGILHLTNHKRKSNCENDLLECALFPPRNDATYNFLMLRREIKQREEKCLSLRRPKNRNMVIQTLKCMVAIKRKLNEKRQSNLSKYNTDNDKDCQVLSNEIQSSLEKCDDKTVGGEEMTSSEYRVQSTEFSKSTSQDGHTFEMCTVGKHEPKNIESSFENTSKENIYISETTESNGHIKKCKED